MCVGSQPQQLGHLGNVVVNRKGSEMQAVIGIIGIIALAVMVYLFYVLLAGSDER